MPTPAVVTPRLRGRPSLSESLDIRERLLATATRLFIGNGYGDTALATIATHAAVTKKTLYRHFPDKPAIFQAVVRRSVSGFSEPLLDDLANADLEEALLQMGRRLIEQWPGGLTGIIRLIYAEAPRFPELARVVDALSDESGRSVASLLRRFAPAGVDVDAAAGKFLELVYMGPQRWLLLRPTEAYAPERRDEDLRVAVALFARSWRMVFAAGH